MKTDTTWDPTKATQNTSLENTQLLWLEQKRLGKASNYSQRPAKAQSSYK